LWRCDHHPACKSGGNDFTAQGLLHLLSSDDLSPVTRRKRHHPRPRFPESNFGAQITGPTTADATAFAVTRKAQRCSSAIQAGLPNGITQWGNGIDLMADFDSCYGDAGDVVASKQAEKRRSQGRRQDRLGTSPTVTLFLAMMDYIQLFAPRCWISPVVAGTVRVVSCQVEPPRRGSNCAPLCDELDRGCSPAVPEFDPQRLRLQAHYLAETSTELAVNAVCFRHPPPATGPDVSLRQ
jgi:hypothetical protein